jgi:hypothetical protein
MAENDKRIDIGNKDPRRFYAEINKSAEFYNELLQEAVNERAKYEEMLEQLSHEMYKAKMMLLAASGDDSFLSETEKSVLEKYEISRNETLESYNFWQARIEKLKGYDSQKYFSQIEGEADIDALLSSNFSEQE